MSANNEMLPCCRLCKWSSGFDLDTFSVQCIRHKLMIRYALSTFCEAFEGDGHQFQAIDQVESGMVYDWVEVSYKDADIPHKSVYHQTFTSLAPVQEYMTWTEDKDRATRLELIAQIKAQLTAELNNNVQ